MLNDPEHKVEPGTKTSGYKTGIGKEFNDAGKIPQSDSKQVAPSPKGGGGGLNDGDCKVDIRG